MWVELFTDIMKKKLEEILQEEIDWHMESYGNTVDRILDLIREAKDSGYIDGYTEAEDKNNETWEIVDDYRNNSVYLLDYLDNFY